VAFSLLQKIGWIKSEAESALDAGLTLTAQLTATRKRWAGEVENGNVVSGTSSGGTSVSFSTPGAGNATPAQWFALAAEMELRYAAAVADLGGSPTDAEILAEMVTDMPVSVGRGPTSFRVDFKNLYA
jgi:hypothetical protein